MPWDPPALDRNQIVLFAERLDEVLPQQHSVRRMAEVLEQLDWSAWEAEYKHEGGGRPPIHPRVMSGIVLYALMRGVRSSRQIEEALQMRLDFRWLAEARSIDHSTICRFRQSHVDRLKQLFVQITLVARHAGLLSLVELAVDGTTIRASNHRSAKFKVAELSAWKEQLELRFAELNAQAEQLDQEQSAGRTQLDRQLENTQSRLAQINRAIEAVADLAADEPVPTRIPSTDVESRVTKSKEGGFAPNYTPVTVVDPESGLIAATEVIAESNEKSVLPGALDEIEATHGVRPERVLGDAIYGHSSNLQEMDERGIALHTPINDAGDNPAIRDDLTRPVPADQWDQLPTRNDQLSKEAFVFDAANNRYFCPNGKELSWNSSYHARQADGTIERHRFHARKADCSSCPLLSRCVTGKSGFRRVSRDEAEDLRDQLRQRMRSVSGQAAYKRRMIGERPFAMIKHWMGVRQFLHRGLGRVRQEWRWAATAFNLRRLLNLLAARAGPRGLLPLQRHPP